MNSTDARELEQGAPEQAPPVPEGQSPAPKAQGRPGPPPWLLAVLDAPFHWWLAGAAILFGATLLFRVLAGAWSSPDLADLVAATERHEAAAELSALEQDLALKRSEMEGALFQGKHVLSLVGELEKEVSRWNGEVAPLLTNDRGKRIAADETAVSAFQEHWQARRPPETLPSSLREQVTTVIKPLEASLERQEGFSSPDALRQRLDSLESQVTEAISAFAQPREFIEGLITAHPEPADITLEEAMARLNAQRAQTSAARITEHIERARAEADAVIALSREELLNAEAARERAQLELEAERERGEATALRAEKDLEALRLKARNPAIQKQLALVSAPGQWQPWDAYGADASRKRIPVSYKGLKDAGVFSASDRSKERLRVLLGNHYNDRPHLPHHSNQTPEHVEQVEHLHRLLLELEPILVEEGILSP